MFNELEKITRLGLEILLNKYYKINYKKLLNFMPNFGLTLVGSAMIGGFVKNEFSDTMALKLFIAGVIIIIVGFTERR